MGADSLPNALTFDAGGAESLAKSRKSSGMQPASPRFTKPELSRHFVKSIALQIMSPDEFGFLGWQAVKGTANRLTHLRIARGFFRGLLRR